MIMGGSVDVATENPGHSAREHRITYALENHRRTDAEFDDRNQDQGDEVAGVSHSFLTD